MSGCTWILGLEELDSRDAGTPPEHVPDGGDIGSGAPDSGIDARPPDGTPPLVVSVSPEPGTAGVVTNLEISVTFNEAIDPDSVAESSFRLIDGRHGRSVLGTTIVEGAEVRFEPAAELTLRERYEIVIDTAVTDVSGTPLAQEWRGAFTVRDGALGTATSLRTGAVWTWTMDMGEGGEAFAIGWDQDARYSRRYQAPSGWGGSNLVSYTDAPSGTAIVAGLDGAALAVWQDGAAWYVDGSVPWVEVPPPGGGGGAKIGIDAHGSGLAAWLEDDGTHTGVWASRFSGAQWSNQVRLDETMSDATSLHLAVDHAGNGMALWAQGDQVWTARFLDGVWEPAAPIEAAASPAIAPRLVMDGDGRGMAFWVQHNGTQYRLRWSSYEPQTGWSQPAFADGGPAVYPDSGSWRGSLGFNSYGDAVVLWSDRTSCGGGESCNVLLAGQFTLEQGWHDIQVISDAYSQFSFQEYKAGIDRHGSVLAAWTVSFNDIALEFWMRRYLPEQGWQPASSGSCADDLGFSELQLSPTPQGRMLVSWNQRRSVPGDAFCAMVLD